ncbi:MAG TPA: hypothetical protein VGI42_02580, partial [Chthoniobacterales bacterium]
WVIYRFACHPELGRQQERPALSEANVDPAYAMVAFFVFKETRIAIVKFFRRLRMTTALNREMIHPRRLTRLERAHILADDW